MSLFRQLQHLYRKDKFQLEDFHTEIVAQVMRNSDALTLKWLQDMGATSFLCPDSITIATQEEFPALAGHATDSRPDIAIRLVQDEAAELVLIESKVGAKEGPRQLQRYADQLRAKQAARRTALVFITRDFEPNRSLDGLSPKLIFRMTRWFKFYEYLKAHVNGDGLASELKLFMEENKMSVRNQFGSIDAMALEGFLAARALMDETMWSEVALAFKTAVGKVSSQNRAMSQLGRFNRYIMYAIIGKNWDLECLLGYYLPNGNPIEPVSVGFMFVTNPKSPIRKSVVAALRDFAKKGRGQWQQSALDDEAEWGTVARLMTLQQFMAETDHVAAIKQFLLSLIKEVVNFKKEHPELPWGTQRAESENEET